MKQWKAVIFILWIVCAGKVNAQNNLCANATPFCTGQTMNFPAGVNAGQAQPGPNYGCLVSRPNPAWFFMQIANPGPMSISMSAAQDIDFICWGPFPSLGAACSNLTQSNIQSCSFSPSNTETCTIANAVAGQFYLMLITNFSNQNQNITFNQSNQNQPGAGSTNCSFVCLLSTTGTSVLCSGQTASVALGLNTSTSVISYTWTGPGGFNSTAPSNTILNIQSTSVYTVVGTNTAMISGSPYSGTCAATFTVNVIKTPSFSLTPTTTSICQGGNFNAGVTFTPGSVPINNYVYSWSHYAANDVFQPTSYSTTIAPLLLPVTTTVATVVYSVTVSPASTLVSCPVTKTLQVTVNNPSTPTISLVPPLCDTFTPVQLTASPGGGVWSANPAVTSGGLFDPSIAAIGINSVKYTVNVGSCTVSSTQTLEVSKFYSAGLTSSPGFCVQDPVFNLLNIVQNTLTGTWSGPNVSTNAFNPAGLATGNYTLSYNTASFPNPTVCPSSTVLVVPVFNPPTPVIASIPPHCDNAGIFTLTAVPSTGVWSGASGISPIGVQTTSLNTIGTSTVLYTAGQGTCVATSSQTFHVSQFNPAVLTGTPGHLCSNGKPMNLMSIVQNTNGAWSGIGVNNNNVFDPTNLPTNTYNLKYQTWSVPNATLCPDTRTASAYVLNPPSPNITQVGPFCTIDKPVALSVTPATGHWVASSYLSPGGTFSPGLSSIGSNIVQYVIGTSTCNTQQSITIRTEAFVPATITSSIADQCTTGPQFNLQPITLSSSGNWKGTGISGTSFNPALSGAGTFTLTYYTSSLPGGLCPDQASIAVNVFSLAVPSIIKTGPFCNNSTPFQLQVSPVGGIFGGGVNGAVTNAGLFNPGMALIGDNIVTYSISSGPCIANAQTHITVEKFISADFAKYADLAYCVNSQPFDLNSLVQNPGGNWAINGSAIGGSMFDPAKNRIGENEVIYHTYSSPKGLCSDVKSIYVKVKDLPSVTAASSRYMGCAPVEVVLTSTVSGAGLGSWYLDDGSMPGKGLSLSHIYTSPGSYSVVFNYEDNEARSCSTQVVLAAIKVNEMPTADFLISPDEITIDNPQVIFTNLSTVLRNNRYTWTIEGLGQLFEVNPVVYFPQIGNYKVTLTAATKENCKAEITKIVEVKNDFSVYVPNVFTPNEDQMNDVFIPVFSLYGVDTKTYRLEIFDRWGHELFSTGDYTKGWDGTVQNRGEEPLKEDVYVFRLKYKDLNGRLYNKIGDVTLLR